MNDMTNRASGQTEQIVGGIHEFDLVLRLNDDNDRIVELNFALLQLNIEVCFALKRALTAHVGHTAVVTQRKTFYSLRLLGKCLRETGLADSVPLPGDVARTFSKWLDASNLGYSAQSHLRTVVSILKWCQRNAPDVVAARATFVVNPIRSLVPKQRSPLGEEVIKQILRACYDDIDASECSLDHGRRLRTGEVDTVEDQVASDLVIELLEFGGGELGFQRTIRSSGHGFARRIQKMGGVRALGELLWLSPNALFPFYLEIGRAHV